MMPSIGMTVQLFLKKYKTFWSRLQAINCIIKEGIMHIVHAVVRPILLLSGSLLC